MKRILTICTILLIGSQCGFAQSFVNLDFESANVPDVPTNGFGGEVNVADGLPGWNAYLNTIQYSFIYHNTFSLGGAVVAIEGPQGSSTDILEGNYTAYLQGSTFGTQASASIAQTAQIPLGSESLQFFASPSANFQVTIAGQPIPLVQLGATANYDIMGADISAFAGQTDELRFTALQNVSGGFLDDIQFSVSPVPEPSIMALFATGALLLAFRRKLHPRNCAMLRS